MAGSIVRRKKKKTFSDKDYELEKKKVLKLLESKSLFDEDSSEEERRESCRDDFTLFCATYLPHYFTDPSPDCNPAIVEALQIVEQPVDIAAPRGWGKSTLLFAFILWVICFGKKKFVVIAMENFDKAIMQTWRILLELQFNGRITNDFSTIVSPDAARGDFTTTTGIRLLAMGAGMSARGLINAQFRPDLFICDDLETRGLARNPRRVSQLLDLILSDYLGCMCAQRWTFVMVGTIICRGSTLDRLQKNKAFKSLKFRAIEHDANGKEYSTWSAVHPLFALHRLRDTMEAMRFSAEKQNEPFEEGSKFDERWFAHWKDWPSDLNMSRLFIQCDPSYSATADNKAIGVWAEYELKIGSKDLGTWKDANGVAFEEGNHLIALEIFNRKCSMHDMIMKIYEWADKYKPRKIFVDGTYGQKAIWSKEFSRYEAKYGFLPLEFPAQRDKKEDKIHALEPDVRRRKIVLPQRGGEDVENTIQQFVRLGEPGIPDDGPDMIAEAKDSARSMHRQETNVFI